MHETDPTPHEGGQGGRGQRPPPFGGREPDADGSAGRALPADSVRDEWAGQPQGRRPGTPGEGEPERAGDGVGAVGTRSLTHFSTFSGIGGLDLGLERAGWRTLAFSEIDTYASAVLAERWPDIPNLGDIVALAGRASREHVPGPRRREPSVREVAGDGPAGTLPDATSTGSVSEVEGREAAGWEPHRQDPHRGDSASVLEPEDGPAGGQRDRDAGGRGPHAGLDAAGGGDWWSATLWTGGFPCQDLSIAGKRRGLGLDHSKGRARDRGLREPDGEGGRSADAGREPDERPTDDGGDGDAYGTRSGLAFAFLDLLRTARLDGAGPTYVLLENVPGLLSSHGGRDMAQLCGALVDIGYGVAYRTVDARYTGVPQRRRRVFILGVRVQDDDPDGHLAAGRAAEILALTASGCGHTQKGGKARPSASPAPRTGLEIAGGLTRRYGKGVNTTLDDGALVVAKGITGHLAKGGASGAGDGEHVNLIVGEAADASGDGAPDGAPRRLDDSPRVEGQEVVGALREHVRPGSNTDHTVFSLRGREEGNVPEVSPDGLAPALRGPGGGSSHTFYIAPETGQGADLTAHEIDEAPAITPTEFVKSTDRGVRVVGAFNSTGGTHSVDFDEDLSPPVRVGSGIDIPSPPAVFVKGKRAQSTEDDESWREDAVAPTVNAFDVGDARATALVAEQDWVGTLRANSGGWRPRAEEHPDMTVGLTDGEEDDLLPMGLDSHRYRACGNAVVVNVAEWLGNRIRLDAEGKLA